MQRKKTNSFNITYKTHKTLNFVFNLQNIFSNIKTKNLINKKDKFFSKNILNTYYCNIIFHEQINF